MADQWNDLLEMLSVNPLHAIFLVLGILLLEIILSFDNAAVLATMVKDLPEKQQSQALRYGIIGAYIFRGVALILVEQILSIWWLKPIGGLYLLWMAFSHFVQKSKDEASEEVQEVKKNLLYRTTVGWIGVFWSTVIAVEFMDIVFSITKHRRTKATISKYDEQRVCIASARRACSCIRSHTVTSLPKHQDMG